MKKETVFNGWYYTYKTNKIGERAEKILGKGGFGCVYEIQKQVLKEAIMKSAMKVIHIPGEDDSYGYLDYTEEQRRMLIQEQVKKAIKEIEAQIKMQGNPNIVRIEDYCVVKKTEPKIGFDLFIRMELLDPIIRRGEKINFSREDIIRMGIDMCNALAECHSKSILHRDVKPQNIFRGERGEYKLGDFGISRVQEDTIGVYSNSLTVKYASPEALLPNTAQDSRADIYSLGLVLYELLNQNRLPFLPSPSEIPRADDINRAVDRRMKGEPVPEIKGIGDGLNCILRKACAFEKEERYNSADEMRCALEALVSNEIIYNQIKPSIEKMPNKIAIVGVGGCGCNLLNYIIDNEMQATDFAQIDFIASATDESLLQKNRAEIKIEFGTDTCRGMACRGNPELGAHAAIENRREFNKLFREKDYKTVIVVCGLGRGTGGGGAPEICKFAKQAGATTVAITMYPFVFEGDEYMNNADEAIDKLYETADLLFMSRAEDVLKFSKNDTSIQNAMNNSCIFMSEIIRAVFETSVSGVFEAKNWEASIESLEKKSTGNSELYMRGLINNLEIYATN